MECREKIAWALAGVFGLAIIGAGIAFGAVAAYEWQKSDTKASEQASTGFERTAADLLRVVANRDVEGYLALQYPEPRPTAEQVRDMFANSTVDVAGCDTSGATFRTAPVNDVISLDMTFARPCGDFGATRSCNFYFKRADEKWWIYGWGCNIGDAGTATPTASG